SPLRGLTADEVLSACDGERHSKCEVAFPAATVCDEQGRLPADDDVLHHPLDRRHILEEVERLVVALGRVELDTYEVFQLVSGLEVIGYVLALLGLVN